MKHISVLLFFAIFFVVFADTGTLQKVVDGDTLYFRSNGRTVKCRMAWIDTPEPHCNERVKRKAKACLGVTLCRMVEAGKKARDYAKSILHRGETYHFEVTGHDRYGRAICVVKMPGGGTFNEKMVVDGYAVPFWKYIPSSLERKFGKLLKEAKQKRAGLWVDYRPVMKCLSRKR